MKPLLVSRVTDVEGNVVEEVAPSVRRQVVPRSVARLVADMLTAVTGPGGTGEAAAHRRLPRRGQDRHRAEGRLRARRLRRRQVDGDVRRLRARAAAAPRDLGGDRRARDRALRRHGRRSRVRRIAVGALRHLGVPPEASGDKLADVGQAAARAATPVEARRAGREARCRLERASRAAAREQPAEGQVRVPDLTGYGARAALVALAQRRPRRSRSRARGAVVEQRPPAGAIVSLGASVQPGAASAGRTRAARGRQTQGLAAMAPTRWPAPARRPDGSCR